MDELQVFSIAGAKGHGRRSCPFRTETELQRFVIHHAERLVAIRILAREHVIHTNGGGRIDAVGTDGRSTPVVVEFKRNASGLTICQGLHYLDWLDQHLEVFAEIVMRRFGDRKASKIRWNSARLVCIAEEIGAREEAVARQIGRQVELLQLRRY